AFKAARCRRPPFFLRQLSHVPPAMVCRPHPQARCSKPPATCVQGLIPEAVFCIPKFIVRLLKCSRQTGDADTYAERGSHKQTRCKNSTNSQSKSDAENSKKRQTAARGSISAAVSFLARHLNPACLNSKPCVRVGV